MKARNARVETDKAWETSFVRKVILMVFTYLAIGIYLKTIEVHNPWQNAIVPAIAFLLSTLTLPYFKKFWEKYVYKK